MPSAAGQHQGKDGGHRVDHAGHVDREDFVGQGARFPGAARHGRRTANAGIGNEDIDRPLPIAGKQPVAERPGIHHIEQGEPDFSALGAAGIHRGIEPPLIATGQRQQPTGGGIVLGEGAANGRRWRR